jgi:hypothetical protein
MTEDPNRTVQLIWDDHIGGANNATLRFINLASSSGGRNTAAFYTFSPADDISFLSLDATAGITNMRFTIDDKMEEQGGLGFAVQDDVVFSASSCFNPDPNDVGTGGRFDIAVCATMF